MEPTIEITHIAMVHTNLIVYFADGKRLMLRPEQIYALESDSRLENDLRVAEQNLQSFEAGC